MKWQYGDENYIRNWFSVPIETMDPRLNMRDIVLFRK